MEQWITDNSGVLIPAVAVILDLIAGYIPDKYVNYIGFARRLIYLLTIGKTKK